MTTATSIQIPTVPSSIIPRVGLGTMPLSIAGRPDRATAKGVIRGAVEDGIRLIDTADAYSLDESERGYGERLVAEALSEMGLAVGGDPDKGTPLVATKGGMRRPGGRWKKAARPSDLRLACHGSLRALGVESIPLYQLHAPDPEVPLEDSVGALAQLREEGKVRLVGLSNVTVDELRRASEITPLATVQNHASVWDPGYRKSPMVRACEELGLVLLAHSPFGGVERAEGLGDHAPLGRVAETLGLTPHEAALHWLMMSSPCIVPIPGTTNPDRAVGWLRALEAESVPAQRRRLRRALRKLPGQRNVARRIVERIGRLLGG